MITLSPLPPDKLGATWGRLIDSLADPAMLFSPEWRDARPRPDERYFLIRPTSAPDEGAGVLRCRYSCPTTMVFGAGLYPGWRGKGFAPLIRDAALAACFADPAVHKVEMATSSGNAAVLATHTHHGRMRVEGLQRETIRAGDGTFYDRLLLGITRAEWTEQEAARV